MTDTTITLHEFERLPIMELNTLVKDLQGDYFLTPKLVESQRGIKGKGDSVTIYKILEIRDNTNVLYQAIYPTIVEN